MNAEGNTSISYGPYYGDRGAKVHFKPVPTFDKNPHEVTLKLVQFLSANPKYNVLEDVEGTNVKSLPKITDTAELPASTEHMSTWEAEQMFADWDYLSNHDVRGTKFRDKVTSDLDIPNLPPPPVVRDPSKRFGVHSEYGGYYYRGLEFQKFWIGDRQELGPMESST